MKLFRYPSDFLKRSTLLIFCALFAASSFAQSDWVETELFVKVYDHENVDLRWEKGRIAPLGWQALIDEFTIEEIEAPFKAPSVSLQHIYHLTFAQPAQRARLIRKIERLPYVEYAEGVPAYELFYTPNDMLASQWGLNTVQAEQAWDLNTGSANVVIAIVDDAVRLTHQDIAPNLWVNPGEIPGNNVDDDNNGYVDDINGYDVADNDNDPNSPSWATVNDFSHGTHVAAIASGATDNNAGKAAMGFNCSLMAIKTKMDNTQGGGLQAPFQGVDYAIASGADVINMSWGGGAYSATYQLLFDLAYTNNIVCVAAAGNSNTSAPMYPASYNHVISVGSTQQGDAKSSFSNYGSTIDVMAPGTAIWSGIATGDLDFDFKSGTSMAAPLVSGLVGLMITQNNLLSVDEIETCLESSCDNIDAQNQSYLGQIGAGRVNAYEALRCIKPIYADFTCTPGFICPGGTVQFTDQSSNNPTTWEWSFPGGTPATSSVQNPLITYNVAGTYDVTLIATNANGTDTLLLPNHVTVAVPSAMISGNATILAGYSAWLTVDFIGNPPFDFTYSDGNVTTTINGITTSPYYFQVSPSVNTSYTITAMNDAGCAGTFTGQADITVNQSSSCGAASSYNRTYGATQDEKAYASAPSSDGGTIVVGSTESFGAGSEDVYVLKLDACGNEEWSRSYGSTGLDRGTGVIQTFNGDYLVASTWTVSGSNWDVGLIRIDPNGNLVWMNRYGTTAADYPRGLVQAPDGGFVASGVTNSGSGAGGNDLMMMKIDASGVLQWSKAYGNNANDFGHNLQNDPNGGYIMSGYRRDYSAGDRDGYVIRTDSIGDVQWARIIDGTALEYAEHVEPLQAGEGYVVAGRTTSFGQGLEDMYLMRLDLNGDQVWSYTYGGTQLDEFTELELDASGNLVALGATFSIGAGGEEVYVMYADTAGTPLSAFSLGDVGNDACDRGGDNSYLTPEGNLVMAGRTTSFGGGGMDVLVMRTDTSGGPICLENPQTLQQGFSGLNSVANTPVQNNLPFTTTSHAPVINIPAIQDSILCLLQAGCSQPTFERIYGGAGDERTHCLIKTNDGGYMVAANTTSSGAGQEDVLLLKLDSAGNEVWTNTYGGTGEETSNNITIVQLPDSGYAFTSSTESFGATRLRAWFVRLDAAGTVIWESRNNAVSNFDDHSREIIATPDGGLLAVGTSISLSAGGNSDVFATKLDGAGNLEWHTVYGGNQSDHATEVLTVDSSGYLIVAHARSFGSSTGDTDLWLIRIDTLGNIVWETLIEGPLEEGSTHADYAHGGGYIMVGQTNSFGAGDRDVLMIKVDTAGQMEWSKAYGGVGYERGQCVKTVPGGGYIIGGLTESFGNGNADMLMIRTDDFGNVEWSKAFGTPAEDATELWAENIQVADDGGFVMGGHTEAYGNGDQDLYLLKVDGCGETNCANTPVTLTVTNGTLVQQTSNASIASGATITTTTASVAPFTAIRDSSVCVPQITLPDCGAWANFGFDTVCVGDSTHFADLSIDTLGNNIIFWDWDFGDSNGSTGVANPVHLYAVAGSYQVTLVVSSNSPASCQDSITLTVTVVNTMTAYLGPDSTICLGDSVALGPPSIFCGAPPYTYAWTPSATLDDATVANPTAAPGITTDYIVTVTDSLGAISVDTITITVDSSCCVSHAEIGLNDFLHCAYDSITFTNLSVDTTNALYFWNFGIGANPSFFVGQTPPPVFYNAPGQYDISLVLQDDCGNDTTWVTLWIADNPVANAGDSIMFICNPQTVQLGEPPVSDYIYQWLPTTGLNDSSLANPTAFVGATITYSMLVIDTVTGCTTVDTVRVSLSGPSVVINPDTTICPGDDAPLYVIDVFCGTAPYTYDWSPAAGLSATNIPNPIATPGSTTTYTLTVTDSQGETTDQSVTITVLPHCCLTNALISFQVGNYCVGEEVTFTSQSQTQGTATYEWNFGGNANPQNHSGISPPPVSFNAPGNYQVQLIVTDTCTSDTAYGYVNVVPGPPINAGADQLICFADTVQLGTDTAANAAYLWSPASGLDDPTSPNPLAVINGTTTYSLLSTDTLTGCTSTDDITLTFGFPGLELGPNLLLCIDSTISLNATNVNGASYLWQDGSTDPTYLVTMEGTYTVVVINQCDTLTDSVYVQTQDCNCYSFLPNVFSPNGDGYNDVFKMDIEGPTCEIELFEIYNRWGKRVFNSPAAEPQWNGYDGKGNAMSEGTYYYVIVLNGEAFTGPVTLTR